MKLITTIACLFFLSTTAWAQNVEFEKANFPDRKDQLKEARKALDDGRDAFELGSKEYTYILEGYVDKYKFAPVSRKDFQRAGDVYYKQARPLLEKAQEFNPNNALLNYMLGVVSFNLNPQSPDAVKYLEKAQSLNGPLPADANFFLGWAYQYQLKWDEAIKSYQAQLSILSKDAKGNAVQIEDLNKKINECKTGKLQMANPQRIFIDNLGAAINTSYPEYSAFITADESMMVLTSRRQNSTGGKIDEQDKWPFEDLYQSVKVNGKWTEARNFGPIVNSE